MALSRIERGVSIYEPPYIKYPDNPRQIYLNGFPVFEYVSGQEMEEIVRDFAKYWRLQDFDNVLVVANGGRMPFEYMETTQDYRGRARSIEYHRSKNGYNEVDVVSPVPEEIKHQRNVVIEDVYDTGSVLHAVMKDMPNSIALVVVKKIGVPKQIQVPNVYEAVRLDNEWLGGWGMNFGGDYPDNFPRNFTGIFVKLQIPIAPLSSREI